MDIVTISCPGCGAHVERKEGEYFGKCPYCGTEVCFNDIKEEAQMGRIKDELSFLHKKEERARANKEVLKHWTKTRNIFFVIMAVCNTVGFFLVGISNENDPNDDIKMTIGALCAMVALVLLFFAPIMLALVYPCYDPINDRPETGGKPKAFLLLALTALGVSLTSALLAYILFYLFQ